jgi:hypothetical protein
MSLGAREGGVPDEWRLSRRSLTCSTAFTREPRILNVLYCPFSCADPYCKRIVVGTIAFVVGIGMVIGANRIFRRIGTNVNPSQPTVALATTVVFTRTRNSMYVGGSLAILGIAIALALDLVLLLLLFKPASRALRHYPT